MSASSSWLNLAGRTAIVTGAASGIGYCVSKSLFRQGCNVILADTKKPAFNIDQTFSESVQTNRVQVVDCDVTNVSQVRNLIDIADDLAYTSASTEKKSGEPFTIPVASMLVNCAGITRDGFLSKMELDDFDQVLDVNLRGTFLTCKYFCKPSRIDVLSSSQSTSIASIINIGSVVGDRGNIGQTNYAASKGGVVSFTKSLAKEMARYNIRANTICPGFIDTPMAGAVPEKVKQKMLKKIYLGRFGAPQDVADLVCFLSSEKAKYITGEAIECSGLIEL